MNKINMANQKYNYSSKIIFTVVMNKNNGPKFYI